MIIKMARPVAHRDKFERVKPQRQALVNETFDPPEFKELEIFGNVRNLSPSIFEFTQLTILVLADNSLTRVPPEIVQLKQLKYLDLSNNKIRHLPPEIGELINLRELLLQGNNLHTLPAELGRLFQLQHLSLEGNPLTSEFLVIHGEQNGTQRLITYLQDNLKLSIVDDRALIRDLIPNGQFEVSKIGLNK